MKEGISKIAVALAFSPRAEALLSEAKRIAHKFNAEILIFHIGVRTEEKEADFAGLLEKVFETNQPSIKWKNGKVVRIVREMCHQENIDLLILGALQNENLLRYYSGSVARKLSRNPPCSILLVTNPKRLENRLGSVVISGSSSHLGIKNTLAIGVDFANRFGVSDITIVEEVAPKKINTRITDERSLHQVNDEKEKLKLKENNRLIELLKELEVKNRTALKLQCIFGKKGYSIGHFAEVNKASLLVLPAPEQKLGVFDRIFPYDLEYVLSDTPCDLMIVKR